MPTVELSHFQNIAYRVLHYSGWVVHVSINSGLTNELWILFTQMKTWFAVTLIVFLLFATKLL